MLDSIRYELGEDSEEKETLDSINELIESAKIDLKIAGVNAVYEEVEEVIAGETIITKVYDTLIRRAIILYCKANYRYDPFTEKYQELYITLKQHLSLAEEYKEVVK